MKENNENNACNIFKLASFLIHALKCDVCEFACAKI